MTNAVPSKPSLGPFGVWTAGPVRPEQAVEIEKLGYRVVWVGGSPPADLSFVEPILEQTETLLVATGIVNIWSADAAEVAESYHRIDKSFPGRFLLGVGAGHREHTDGYRKPFEALVSYLDVLDANTVPASRRVMAALGPKVLDLAARRQRRCAPLLTTPAHTRDARKSLSPTVLLAPQQGVVLSTDTDKARQVGRPIIDFYLGCLTM